MKMSLKNKSEINLLFEKGKSFSSGLIFAKVLDSESSKFVFAVSSKKFKRAVDRNRIKRLMREVVSGKITNKNIALIYTGSVLPEYKDIEKSMNELFKKL
jgi:ribonuclease P protein component